MDSILSSHSTNMKPKLIIAGPGAGKTHNMVSEILGKLKSLPPSRYLVVITYTNSATENIRNRVSKKIVIPPNLFIGTIHSFLNRFIVVPFSSLHNDSVGREKLFLQCHSDDVFESVKKQNGKIYDFMEAAKVKSNIRKRLNESGYISFDQTIALAKDCVSHSEIIKILSNRIQYLFVDEFQDTNQSIYTIIECLRKQRKTRIYCVGDPEQFIQSFDITSKKFENIPILKASTTTTYETIFNTDNHRCSERIVQFLNLFNNRGVNGNVFQQVCKTGIVGKSVTFLPASGTASAILKIFNLICDQENIPSIERCVVTKKNEVVTRIIKALNGIFRPPSKHLEKLPIKSVVDTLLSSLNMSQSEFCAKYKTDAMTLRKYAIAILKAIHDGTIRNENTFSKYVSEQLGLYLNKKMPLKVENIRGHFYSSNTQEAIIVSNIHKIKGLEAEAVLAIAKTEAELLLWTETDRVTRETYREEETDYPRLGYVAFSRAKKILCIACLEPITATTTSKLTQLGIEIFRVPV